MDSDDSSRENGIRDMPPPSTAAKDNKEKDAIRDRESDMEAALIGNCLLLGLDPSILGQGVGAGKAGLFRHSNPRVGEALLHFLLSALRGPSQAAKDFAGVWPIFDAAQSRDFRKIVQNLINELEAQGALPRSNSRVSSLATCCGQRFVELLWQLSAHALREVHRRNFPSDAASNPLPASLTEVVTQNSHAAALLSVTKARIALERRRFLDGALSAVRRQALWSSLAHDMTAEFRALCAEEAYLHQELEKIQEMQNLKGRIEHADHKTITVARASQLWESLLNHSARHEKLASGPIEDLIAHREHRYRIDGVALRAAIDRSSTTTIGGLSSSLSEDTSRQRTDDDGIQQVYLKERPELVGSSYEGYANEDTRSRGDDRSTKGSTQLDVAEVLRRWTHALQRIHKQSLRLVRSNDGDGPDILKDAFNEENDGHAQALRTTLAEHKQHLSNMQTLVGQLKESLPGMETTIESLRQRVSSSDIMAASQASALGSHVASDMLECEKEITTEHRSEVKNAGTQVELDRPPSTLRLPELLPSSMSSMSKVFLDKEVYEGPYAHQSGLFQDGELETVNVTSPLSVPCNDEKLVGDAEGLAFLRQAVREAALSKVISTPESLSERPTSRSEHYFTPVRDNNSNGKNREGRSTSEFLDIMPEHSETILKYGRTRESSDIKDVYRPGRVQASQQIVHSPPLLMELSLFEENYDDLLEPMLDFDSALVDYPKQAFRA